MKKTKSLLSLLLSLSLLFSAFSLTAYATEEEPTSEEIPPSEQVEEIVPVEATSLEELLSAIEAAEDGDTIVLCNQINITENCTIGDIEKAITLLPKDSFTSGAFFAISHFPAQSIVFQNLVMDGQNATISAISANSIFATELTGTLTLYDVHIKNFASKFSTVTVYAMDAVFDNCHFTDNSAKRCAGIECDTLAEVEMLDCLFNNNISTGNGCAFRCMGTAKITNSEITNNTADGDNSVVGGGISIENGAYCEITNCKIVNNTADLGGGVYVDGTVKIFDTLLYGNMGSNGANDIYAPVSSQVTVNYSDGMGAVYTENDPIGFYADYFGNPFDPVSNAIFLGETLNVESTEAFYGVKFIFAADLPKEDTPSTETPEVPTTPDAPETPTEPEEPENKPAPSRPSRPIHIYVPPVKQEKEPEKLELSHGGATLDTATPLVLLGYGDGQLYENDLITRAQIAVLLYRSLTDESKAVLGASTSIFADVENGEWYYDAVSALSSAGVINGCDGLFAPNDNLTWGQLIALLTRFVEPKTAAMPESIEYTEHWAYSNIVTAVAYGWLDDAITFDPNRPVTRGETVDFVNSIFERSEAADIVQ